MKRWAWLSIISLFFSFNAIAINLLPSHTVFYMPDDNGTYKPYLELYWQIESESIQYKKDSTGVWLGKIITEITISNDTGVIIHDKYLLLTTPANSLRAAQLQNILDLHRYVLPTGNLNLSVTLTDKYTGDSTNFSETINVPPSTSEIFYSEAQLLDTTYKKDIGGTFSRNGITQIPLSSNYLSDNRKVLHYYVELYNSHKADAAYLPLMQKVFISKKAGESHVYKLIRIDTLKTNKVLPILGSFDISPLPSGNYYLNIELSDVAGNKLTKQNLFFQRSNANPTKLPSTTVNDSGFVDVQVFDLSTTFVTQYDIRQLKAIMKMLTPISTETEYLSINGFSSQPDLTYMRYFLYNFWKSRFPLKPEKGWKAYADKVRWTNKNYGSRARPGYETDRGIVYLKYGKPDQITTVSNESGARPYEVWQYNAPAKQGVNGIFLFYQPGYMVGNYKLLHSTVIGEVSNKAWRTQLYNNGVRNRNVTSQAEIIIQNK